MPPSRLQNASQTLQDAEKLSSNRSYLQVRFLLQCLIAELSIAQDSTNTRRIKIIENRWFLLCSKTFLSGPLHWRSHANGFLNVRHIPFKNESKAVSYIYENASKMANDSNIGSKIRKNTLSTPQDASKMLWQRFQDASKTPIACNKSSFYANCSRAQCAYSNCPRPYANWPRPYANCPRSFAQRNAQENVINCIVAQRMNKFRLWHTSHAKFMFFA